MNSSTWEKVNQFLTELRCEEVSRSNLCQTEEYMQAVSEKAAMQKEFLVCVSKLPEEVQQIIQGFLRQSEKCAFAECQQSYIQGYIDCVQVLIGAGIIKPAKEVSDIVENLCHIK